MSGRPPVAELSPPVEQSAFKNRKVLRRARAVRGRGTADLESFLASIGLLLGLDSGRQGGTLRRGGNVVSVTCHACHYLAAVFLRYLQTGLFEKSRAVANFPLARWQRFYPSGGELRNFRSEFYETFVKAIAPVVGPGWRGRFSMGFSGVYPWSLSSAWRSAFGIGTRHFRSFRPLAVRYTGAQLRSFLGISTNTLPGSRITLQRSSSGVPYLPLQLCSLMAWLISSISGIILTSPPLTGVFSDSSMGCVK